MPELPPGVSDALLGPVAALAFAIFGLIGFVRGWWVPGSIYQKVEQRADKATSALEAIGVSLDRLTDEIRDRRHGGA